MFHRLELWLQKWSLFGGGSLLWCLTVFEYLFNETTSCNIMSSSFSNFYFPKHLQMLRKWPFERILSKFEIIGISSFNLKVFHSFGLLKTFLDSLTPKSWRHLRKSPIMRFFRCGSLSWVIKSVIFLYFTKLSFWCCCVCCYANWRI